MKPTAYIAATEQAAELRAQFPQYRFRVTAGGGYFQGCARAFCIEYIGAEVKWWRVWGA